MSSTLRSAELIAAHQHPSGAYPASPAFPVYRYSWFRDGAFIAEGASRAGDADGATRFHRWCAGVLRARADRIAWLLGTADPPRHEDFLPTRYTLDGADETGSGWWNFQLDGYGSWVWALAEHTARHGVDAGPFADAVALVVRYLSKFHDTPCYDWWEEHPERVHVATLGSIYGGLGAALSLGVLPAADAALAARTRESIAALVGERGRVDGGLAKWLGGGAVDASLLACLVPFALEDPSGPVGAATLAAVERDLVHDHGVHRYREDTFYGGGRWPVLAGFLGWIYARTGRADEARAQLDWIASTADARGHLPEQVGDPLLAPARRAEWVDRWGEVARPLLWSHGMHLILADELNRETS
jgi:GH15 family glucan-1,4-alpha-glucosidase